MTQAMIASLANVDLSIRAIVLDAHWVVQAVMLLLLLMSAIGWYIIVHKSLTFRKVEKQTKIFTDRFWKSRNIDSSLEDAQNLQESPVATMFLAGYSELSKLSTTERNDRDSDRDGDLDNVSRALHRSQTQSLTQLESMIPFLATTGSAAPFIGLFGTVWGIMFTVRSLGNSAQLSTLGPDIAEALLATAVGLIAAIPAVMAYNYFQRRLRILRSEMHTFEQDYLNIVRRHFLA